MEERKTRKESSSRLALSEKSEGKGPLPLPLPRSPPSRLALNVYVEEVNWKLSRWTVAPPEGQTGETIERMCSEMCAKYGADRKVMLRISGHDYVTGQFRTVSSDKIRLKSVTYDLIGQLVVDDWHLKPKDAVFELTLLL